MSRSWFLAGLARERQTDDLATGIQAFIKLYYDNYTDATELDVNVVRMLRSLVEEAGVGIDVDLLIHETETAINENGGIESETGFHHPVRTPTEAGD